MDTKRMGIENINLINMKKIFIISYYLLLISITMKEKSKYYTIQQFKVVLLIIYLSNGLKMKHSNDNKYIIRHSTFVIIIKYLFSQL